MVSAKLKLFSAAVGAAALIATPALASKAHKRKAPDPSAHASKTERAYGGNAIYSWDGRYRGTDPDPNIRFQLMRDQNLPND
ncbi:MAG: hypothetical protein WB540_08870 [Pseudolabrys sp.]|jgi:hypothetical protein